MALDTLLLYAGIVASGFYRNSVSYWKPAFLITAVCVLFSWLLFAIIRYVKVNRFIKSGICVVVCGLFLSLFDDILNWILEGVFHISLADANLQNWTNETMVNTNIFLLILLSCCIIGFILIIIGMMNKRVRAANTGRARL